MCWQVGSEMRCRAELNAEHDDREVNFLISIYLYHFEILLFAAIEPVEELSGTYGMFMG